MSFSVQSVNTRQIIIEGLSNTPPAMQSLRGTPFKNKSSKFSLQNGYTLEAQIDTQTLNSVLQFHTHTYNAKIVG